MLEQRFGRIERETKQLREELNRTQDALDQMKHGLITIQGDQQLTASELRAELSKLTLAIGALTSGSVTVRTREVQYNPSAPAKPETPPPPEWARAVDPALPAASAVVDGSGAVNATVSPPRPRPGVGSGTVRQAYKKPTYSPDSRSPTSPELVPTGRSAPQAEPEASPLPQSAQKARSLADRVLRALGVDPPNN
jgi:hypothetical protein